MPRIATKLAPSAHGGFIARKVIPGDVKDDYARLYGQRTEERLNTGPMSILQARAKHREWATEIETRIANIRAGRRGEGRTLTPQEARALAAEWYRWYTARETNRWPAEVWQDYHARMIEELQAAAITCGVHAGDPPLELLESNPAIRDRVRPLVADEGKTEQYLVARFIQIEG